MFVFSGDQPPSRNDPTFGRVWRTLAGRHTRLDDVRVWFLAKLAPLSGQASSAHSVVHLGLLGRTCSDVWKILAPGAHESARAHEFAFRSPQNHRASHPTAATHFALDEPGATRASRPEARVDSSQKPFANRDNDEAGDRERGRPFDVEREQQRSDWKASRHRCDEQGKGEAAECSEDRVHHHGDQSSATESRLNGCRRAKCRRFCARRVDSHIAVASSRNAWRSPPHRSRGRGEVVDGSAPTGASDGARGKAETEQNQQDTCCVDRAVESRA